MEKMSKSKIQDYTIIAVKQANKNHDCRFKHGAIIFNKSGIVSIGYNRKSPNMAKKYGYKNGYLHAELDALRKANFNVKGCSIIVIRNCKTKIGNSRPCDICQRYLENFGIENVYFSTREGGIAICSCSSMVEHSTVNREVEGSSPSTGVR